MGIATAVIGGVSSLASIGMGISDRINAKRESDKLLASQQAVPTPYANTQVPTLGAELQSQQSLRALATGSEAASRGGLRGQAMISSLSGQNALTGRQIAADLNEKQMMVERLRAQGQQFKYQAEEDRFNRQMAGFANQYNQGTASMMSGLSNLAGTAASGFAQGGAFSGMGGGQGRMPAVAAPTTTLGTQQFQTQGFQPLVIQ